MSILIWYLSVINFTTWAAYGLDKGRAKSGKWRIPERTLLLLALIGGSLGALAGMIMFRHKTRKAKFFISVPVMFVVHCVIVAMLVYMK
ncbi:DUF1294 domain-containing protein [Mediterraneibacter glycyrrhizinilyticus]|jgi:uncharacterized membrane protein YsdA (DUF1294 family)|uniref:DUF1294 domain-containing protein n=1 Tax=Candidatus Mediterraneibacter faecipullorum TaxID=2838670 RepID=A0A9D2NLU3_9FIRM|nr:DUF1294 domain-containing protein [Mediterraneibacter glycyrrhizinilyticus]MBM6801121.1 DUF1294 domain-containing protein [Mediterraneibacter glycyrrhizinilyticus]MDM8125430.1 DUF1294 domain-containing protein [Mediterraneibacter glycyrrhizinilyticus]HJC34652.1 DUF1294 domain-containing protein [Candidatus Mediterraneibacter faecipullorum]